MKSLRLLGFVLCAPLASFGQNSYDPFVSESKLWSELSGGYGSMMIECCHQTTFVQFSKGSSTAGAVEKVALVSTDSLRTWKPIGTIVEFNKKVYYSDLSSSQSRLLFDFGVTEGKSLYLANYCNNEYRDTVAAKITKIDTVSYLGKLRKRFSVEYRNRGTDYWIEGIGSLRGFLNTCIGMTGGFRELLCVQENHSLIYQARGTCYKSASGIEVGSNTIKDFKVYASDSNRRLKIDHPDGAANLSYSIRNLMGQEIGGGLLLGKWIDVNLKTGIYFLRISENNQPVFEHRFVITK